MYKYTRYLNDLKDLKHIEWFVCHSDEYEFHSSESIEILNRLKKNISKKNIFYTMIVDDYNKLASLFDNDPYNYVFNIEKREDKAVKSPHYYNYFVEIIDSEKKKYYVPYGYVVDNSSKYNMSSVSARFNNTMRDRQTNALSNFNYIRVRYESYMGAGGVNEALQRYASIRNGKNYHLIRSCILYLFYNILLIILLSETQFFKILNHFWQFWSDSASAYYSLNSIFGGHKFFGAALIIFIVYFIVLDVCYTYGIWYMIYMKGKYESVLRHHKKVKSLMGIFERDYKLCTEGINSKVMVSRRWNRDNVYIPLINKTGRFYDFNVTRTVKTGTGKDRKKEKKSIIAPLSVPWKSYYKRPITTRIIWLWLALVVFHIVCGYTHIRLNMLLF